MMMRGKLLPAVNILSIDRFTKIQARKLNKFLIQICLRKHVRAHFLNTFSIPGIIFHFPKYKATIAKQTRQN